MALSEVVMLVIAVFVITASLVVTLSQNLLHSAFALFAAMFGIGALYVVLHADFLSMVQVLVYAGGISVLFVFGTMLTREVSLHPEASNPSYKSLWPFLVVALVSLPFARLLINTEWAVSADVVNAPTTASLGRLLLSDYLLPFEVISFLLLAALIGSLSLVLHGESES